ncbi:hypothetical protein [Hymenobacter sp. B81]|uniref:hypothetical protein n=1 Tax=Hymenobacter sp. B81 TaxID=3344878 RepID=UPI0037DCA345
MRPQSLVSLLLLLTLTQCSKCKDDPAPRKPEDRLPAATQTGANTFGCLLNGQPWTPQGDFSRPGLVVSYDPGFGGGSLLVRATRIVNGERQYLSFGGGDIVTTGTYLMATGTNKNADYSDTGRPSPCDYYWDGSPGISCKGSLTITRLDVGAGVISGTFEFVLHQPGCDTIKVTHGRFDKQL